MKKLPKELFVSNLYDPTREDAESRLVGANIQGDDRAVALAKVHDWLKDKAIGLPMPSLTKSVDELVALGFVGVYNRIDPKALAEEKSAIPTIDNHPIDPVVED